jgi:hypothetical protein
MSANNLSYHRVRHPAHGSQPIRQHVGDATGHAAKKVLARDFTGSEPDPVFERAKESNIQAVEGEVRKVFSRAHTYQ